ncbi:MAG: acetone carboxylase subunit alpha, partial [Promethearchaeota archaeon]
VYGVIAKYNEVKREWELDEKATETQQEELKTERREKSMNFEEYWEKEKMKIIENKLSDPVKLMYSESLMLSNNWAKEFKEFWKLPDNFEMEVK